MGLPNSRKTGPARKVAFMGLLAAAALVLSFLENSLLVTLNLSIPGAKPGLANLAVLVALARLGWPYALVVALIKATAVFLATGALTTLWFSLAGSIASVAAMALLWRLGRRRFSLAGVSALGGAVSNAVQLLAMVLLTGAAELIYYLPILVALGTLFGLVVGMLANLVTSRLPRRAAGAGGKEA